MAIGNLNVSVTANTSNAIAGINALRGTVKGLGSASQQAAGQVNQMGGVLDNLKQFKGSLNQLKAGIGGATAVLTVFVASVKFGQKLKEWTQDIHSWKDAMTQVGAVLGLNASLQEEFNAKMERRQQILDAQGRAAVERATAEREMLKKFDKRLEEGHLDRLEAQGYNVDRKFSGDVEEFGLQRALQLSKMRKEAARFEEQATEKKRLDEERIEKLKERSRKFEQQQAAAEKRARDNRRKDQEEIQKLRDRVTDFWKTPLERERDALKRTLEDPRLRMEADFRFAQLQAAERVKAQRKADKQVDKLSLTTADPLSREGFRQRVASMREGSLAKIAKDQLAQQRRTADACERFANQPRLELSPAGLAE
jgi:hypothetical protein